MYGMDGKVAIVTGAARMKGIGRACALALAKAGADVVITGTSRPPSAFPPEEKKAGWRGLASVAGEIESLGKQVMALTSDATDSEAVQSVVQATFGAVCWAVVLTSLLLWRWSVTGRWWLLVTGACACRRAEHACAAR